MYDFRALQTSTASEPLIAEYPSIDYHLSQPYSNSGSDKAQVILSVAASGPIQAYVTDLLGRHVATIFDGYVAEQAPAFLHMDTNTWASGVYVLHVSGPSFSTTRSLRGR